MMNSSNFIVYNNVSETLIDWGKITPGTLFQLDNCIEFFWENDKFNGKFPGNNFLKHKDIFMFLSLEKQQYYCRFCGPENDEEDYRVYKPYCYCSCIISSPCRTIASVKILYNGKVGFFHTVYAAGNHTHKLNRKQNKHKLSFWKPLIKMINNKFEEWSHYPPFEKFVK